MVFIITNQHNDLDFNLKNLIHNSSFDTYVATIQALTPILTVRLCPLLPYVYDSCLLIYGRPELRGASFSCSDTGFPQNNRQSALLPVGISLLAKATANQF